MRIFLISLLSIVIFSSCSFTQKALRNYSSGYVKEGINEIKTFGYNRDGKMVVNFNGRYLGSKRDKNYHFEMDLNGVITEYNKDSKDSILQLHDKYSAARVYEIDHDYSKETPSILTIEVRKDKVKNGFYKGDLITLEGETNVYTNGRKFSYDMYERGYVLSPSVIQFLPKVAWYARSKKHERISFVMQPTYNRNELKLLLVPLGLAADAAMVVAQIFLIQWIYGN